MPCSLKQDQELNRERGFTLVEVLAAIVILSIVALVLTSYFTNAMSYSKASQNKTVMVNLARNALLYIEKNDFDTMERFFAEQGNDSISADQCAYLEDGSVSCSAYSALFPELVLVEVLNPTVNNIQYTIRIDYQEDIRQEMQDDADPLKKEMSAHLLPVSVTVTGPAGVRGNPKATVVEGYITDEEIR